MAMAIHNPNNNDNDENDMRNKNRQNKTEALKNTIDMFIIQHNV